jgi:hypothetical protein
LLERRGGFGFLTRLFFLVSDHDPLPVSVARGDCGALRSIEFPENRLDWTAD